MRRMILVGSAAADALRRGSATISSLEAVEDPAVARERERLSLAMPSIVANLRSPQALPGRLWAPDDELTSVVQSALAEYAEETGDVAEVGDDALEARFDRHDVTGWLFEFVPAWLAGRFKRRAFRSPTDVAKEIPASARLAIFGDWGSGLYGAPPIARSIEAASERFDVVMHLGDVYYAGTKREVRQNMLDLWPTVPGAVHRALNSNHEMYSGGEGYFDLTLNDPRFAGQGSSCFAMGNEHFLLLGLDSAYEGEDLGDEQVAWIRRNVAEAAGRKVILFSHHPLFSGFRHVGKGLAEKLGDLLASRALFAWYWAHEHRCVLYDRHEGWGLHGRCVGHGGYPALRDELEDPVVADVGDGAAWRDVRRDGVPRATVLDGPNPYVRDEPERYAPNGYVALHLDGDRVHEVAHAPNGAVILTREIR